MSGILTAISSGYSSAVSIYLISEGFEGTGYENSWTEVGAGTIDEDYTSSPAPLDGSQSLRIATSVNTGAAYVSYSAQSDVFVFFMINETVVSNNGVLAAIQDGSGNNLVSLEHRTSDDKWVLRSGAKTGVPATAFPAGTTYYAWMRYTKGTGANNFASAGVSTTSTEPTSGSNYASITDGTATADAARFMFGRSSGNHTRDVVFDKLRIKSTSIGSNPS